MIEVGNTYGRWTVLEIVRDKRTSNKRQYTHVYAKCRCNCGTEKLVYANNLVKGRSKSCGCLNYESNTVDPTIKALHYVMTYTLSSAKKRMLEHTLTLDDLRSLIFSKCNYCDELPFVEGDSSPKKYAMQMAPHHGIDRIDSGCGYFIGNVTTCCSTCNTMKLDLTESDFYAKIAKIYAHRIQGQKMIKPSDSKFYKYYDGLVILQDCMGGDLSVVNAARASFNKQSKELSDKDASLIKYLADNKHMSPFRHVQVSLILQNIPEFVLRQLYKHQVGMSYTAGDFREAATVWNEVSGRYVEFDYDFFEPTSFRPQHESNKQASYAHRTVKEEDAARALYKEAIRSSWNKYHELLKLGVAREQARMVLPLSFNTSVMWTSSLEGLAHFVKLRDHEGAQVEIRELAVIVRQILDRIAPVSTRALLGEP